MDIYFGVDGTGPSDDDEYIAAFAQSHVQRIWKEWHTPTAGYIRGPSLTGSETKGLMEKGFVWINEKLKLNPIPEGSKRQNRIFLSGYSRGGAAVIALAHKLKDAGIDVHALLLFDAVDRSSLSNTEKIPANVSACYHARRDPKAGSRESFGNCGTKWEATVAYTEKYFYCTHGGVGGTPWKENGKSGKIEEMSNAQKAGAIIISPISTPIWNEHDFTNVTVEQDKAGSEASWKWMSQNLRLARASKEAEGVGSFGTMGKVRHY